jgi:hypothetical protein
MFSALSSLVLDLLIDSYDTTASAVPTYASELLELRPRVARV